MADKVKIKFFKSPSDWRKWLEAHHAELQELLSAKKEETRLKRLDKLIEYSAQGQTIPQFTPIRKSK